MLRAALWTAEETPRTPGDTGHIERAKEHRDVPQIEIELVVIQQAEGRRRGRENDTAVMLERAPPAVHSNLEDRTATLDQRPLSTGRPVPS